jgi:hypothetical protein
LSLPLGCSITVAAPTFITAADWAKTLPVSPRASAALQQTCLINFMANLHTGRADPTCRHY